VTTYNRWRNQLGGLKGEDIRRLKDLGPDDATVERLSATQAA
jgi:hypothetical protein